MTQPVPSGPKTYPGMAFHPSFPKGKTSGPITLTANALQFQPQDSGDGVALPYQEIQITRGGASNRLIFFKHPGYPQWTVYTADHSILEEFPANAMPDVHRQVNGVKKQRHRARFFQLAILLAIVALFYGLLQLRNPISRAIVKRIPVQWEQKLGDTVFKQYTIGKTIVKDPDITEQLESITHPLMERIPDKRYAFTINIIVDPTLNAFALPGGQIVLNSGLLLSAKSPEEVLGVLAHEIAHVTHQHGIRKMVESAGLFLIVQSLLGDISGVLAVIAENGAFLLNQKFSRSFEQEADEAAFDYLVNANINPMGLVDFFQRLLEERQKDKTLKTIGTIEDQLNFLSTHPAAGDRIKYLNKKWDQLDYKKDFRNMDSAFSQFQTSLKEKIHIKKNPSEGQLK